ncbi:MAG TPA: hypothetical protein VME22_02715 [Solirubrobacteraceae bacterium]|nr:hypothetical protein [Solirubrobacteraceae bacterium]
MNASARPVGCGLGEAGFGWQLRRYHLLSEHVISLERTPGKVVAELRADLPGGLLENTLEVERGCCRFVEATYEPAHGRLTLAVQTINQDPRLDSLFRALDPASGT